MDRLTEVLVRLVRLHDCFGDEVFEHAAGRALLAIGMVALEQAEREHKAPSPTSGAVVIPFPTVRNIPPEPKLHR